MFRTMIRTLAVAAGLGAGAAYADEPAQRLGRYVPGESRAVAAPAAPADDTESIFHRRTYGGYRGYAYRPYTGFSFGYSTYYYAPRYYAPPVYYAAPRFYAPPVYYYTAPSYYGGYYGIGGSASSGSTVPLDIRTPSTGGTFRYDGGPSHVIPQPPVEDTLRPLAPRPTDDAIKIAWKPAVDAKPKYKAYGEK